MKKILLTISAIMLFSLNANALFELRAGYGLASTSGDSITTPTTPVSTTTLETLNGFNLDAIVEIPLFPVGLGIRYEDMSMDAANTLLPALDGKFKRVSAIVNYRLIDFFAYFGFIGTLGLSNEFDVEITGVGTGEWDSSLTYSLGVEGGVSLGLISVGAEVGQLFADMEPTGTTTGSNVDLSGFYAKVLVGVGF
ncbi:MAG: hypothetical protein HRT44_06865 [Bdellovibrionales bacterium]|nr:hypothetical protein [Bdellovibrionales bacterium]NQZ18959.1 hypothetical protein [Bdellovibrionales bacterium]